MSVRGVRGAITVNHNGVEEINEAIVELVSNMLEANQIGSSEIASLIISTTPDIDAVCPAGILREKFSFDYVPLLNLSEMPVKAGLPLCMRVLLHWNTTKSQHEIHHIYLREAVKLRPDLVVSVSK